MDVTLYLVTAVIIILMICAISYIKHKNTRELQFEVNDPVPAAPNREAAPVIAGGVRVRNRRRLQRVRQDSDDEEEFGEEDFEHVALPDGKIGAKKMKKLQEKEEKRRNREAELAEREERKEQEKLREEQNKKEEARKALEEKKIDEEAKRIKEEEEAREYEEYLKLKAEFEVHEEGTQEQECDGDGESLIQRFITYIQDMKVVMFEDLAAHFKIKTQDCIDRIKDLQEEGRLSGVLDDRGKFIHITREEYEAVAKFIKQRGRVSITELAESSNSLINLNPDNQETHKRLITEVSS